jgi:hypothetical protein
MEQDDVRARNLIDEIGGRFPEIAERVRSPAGECEPAFMLNAFSSATTEALANNNEGTARAYLEFVSARIDPNDNHMFELIDTCYVEPLMTGLPTHCKAAGLRLMPANLQRMFLRDHGAQEEL